MERRVWVIERDGEPLAAGIGEAPAAYGPAGTTVTWYVPADTTRVLVALLRATADTARATAYASGTRAELRAIFAGRADGLALAADWLAASAEPVPPAGKPPAAPR
jgi:hypothetical protein